MIVTRTPLRISFFGGGSDIPQFYEKRPGLVLSATINKSIQLAVHSCEPKHVRVVYSELEQSSSVEHVKHERVKAALKRFDIKNNIEIVSFSDITTRGSGLGSSSTYTVGLLNALYNLKGISYTRKDLAEMACDIEINELGEPIGKQDQYAAAYGGLNTIRFDSTGVEVTPMSISYSNLETLNENLLCYSTGITREASSVLGKQVENLKTKSTLDSTSKLVLMAEIALKHLRADKLDDFGALLHEAWEEKKKLAEGISNEQIDKMYDIAMRAGALGGKVLGAGGGGYMLFYANESNRNKVKEAMKDYKQFHFKFTDQGSTAVTL